MPLTAEGLLYRDSLIYTQGDIFMTFYNTGVTPETGTLAQTLEYEVGRFEAQIVDQSFNAGDKVNTITITASVSNIIYGIGDIEYSIIGILRETSGTPIISPELNGTFSSTTSMNLGANYLTVGDKVAYGGVSTTVVSDGSTIIVADAIFPSSGVGVIYYANGVLLTLQDVGAQIIDANQENITYILKTKTAGQG